MKSFLKLRTKWLITQYINDQRMWVNWLQTSANSSLTYEKISNLSYREMKWKINIAFLSYQIGKNPKIWQYIVSETVRKWLLLYSACRNPAAPVPIEVHLSVSNKIIDTFIYWLSNSISRSISPRYRSVCKCACMLLPQPCLTLCDPMDCRVLLGSSIHGILQARILEWVAMSSSRGSSEPRDWTHGSCVFCITGGFFTSELLGKP